MSLKVFNTCFADIADKPSLRIDANYRYFVDVLKSKVWDNSIIPLGDLLSKVQSEKKKKGLLDDSELLVDLSNIERRFNSLKSISPTYEIGSDKIVMGKGDLVIPKIQPRMGNMFFNEQKICYLGSSEFVEYKCNEAKILPKFLLYVLCHPVFLNTLFLCESGKTHRRVAPSELLSYKIPFVSIDVQKEVLESIDLIEQEIHNIKNKVIPSTDIIDEIFEDEFKLSRAYIKSLYKERYNYNLNDLSKSYDIRSSFRFNSRKYDFLDSNLFKNNKFSDVLEKGKTTLGRQMSPDEICEGSDYYYVNANSIKLDYFDEDVLTPITDSFYEHNKQLRVDKNDILLVSSGEGSIGKAIVFNSDKDCITSQFVMKLHPRQNANVNYILYYMQSFIFQNIVEKFKKGKGNMTNIFSAQLLDFPIILPNSKKQEELVQLIQKGISKQHQYDGKIASLRLEIDRLIEKALKI